MRMGFDYFRGQAKQTICPDGITFRGFSRGLRANYSVSLLGGGLRTQKPLPSLYSVGLAASCLRALSRSGDYHQNTVSRICKGIMFVIAVPNASLTGSLSY